MILWLIFCVCTQTQKYITRIVYFSSMRGTYYCVSRLDHSVSILNAHYRPPSVPPVYMYIYVIVLYSNRNRFCVGQILGIHFPSCLPAAAAPSSWMADAPCFWSLLGLWFNVDWRDEIFFFYSWERRVFQNNNLPIVIIGQQ